MSALDGWTPGHKPSALHELPTGGYRLTWSRPGLDDAVQYLDDAGLARLRARLTLPPVEPLSADTPISAA